MYQNFLIISESFKINMFFPLKISDWDMSQYKLILELSSIVLIVVLLVYIAWKKELIGGIIFTVIGLALSPFIYKMNYNMNHSVAISLGVIAAITFPFIVAGALFIISHFLKRKHNIHE